jgi:hypothetical protein
MLTTAALLLFLSQSFGAAPSHSGPSNDCNWCVEDSVSAAQSHLQDRPEEQELIRRFKELISALKEFSRIYNSRGVVDVKKVKAVRKAVRELEKSDWFSQKDERRALR